ncbi:sugar phosphate isomerase/epimerase [Thermosporothrix hazakensis]|uniref:Sugar phosphate isomerase/epimerase n=2 Tax=Thermosporothrix TaxID=768650 RepID=A0A326U9X6_THEHA|nr:sugar phosphate isomerase/epimerase family protein [Thermosporothrix hazakensis]PZW31934.1 sugar phosphate isomerase/epimerase [Thermosporothrix hazakensis]BBH91596.1 AP endonuclease [Thermosporothrix sp. COM3]GCE49741.1 AP endonuclease [Thermosporothrix hazakensis]
MSQIKGPAIFLAQFAQDAAPFNTLPNITNWAKELGYLGIQIPGNESRFIDLDKAATSKQYCDDLKGQCNGLEITEIATHLIGQLVAVHPAYDVMFDAFAPKEYRNNPQARAEWATQTMIKAIKASRNLDLNVVPTFSGALLWHTMYPWPQRPAGLVELGFKELARRWQPILNAAEEYGVDLAYEIHPGEDLHDGVSFERFLEATGNHPRVHILYDPSHFVLQHLDYIGYIEVYKEHIKAFHVKDAEFNPSPRSGVYGGYQDWVDRPGRFRSLGDGQVDFKKVFSKLTQIGFSGWAVLEWECCLKDADQGAREGAPFIKSMLIDTPKHAFDDFAGGEVSEETNRRILGLA